MTVGGWQLGEFSDKFYRWNTARRDKTVRLISIVHPQTEGKFTPTPGGLTSVFYGCIDYGSLWSELVNAIIKKVMAPHWKLTLNLPSIRRSSE
jgi:hypothetical protein